MSLKNIIKGTLAATLSFGITAGTLYTVLEPYMPVPPTVRRHINVGYEKISDKISELKAQKLEENVPEITDVVPFDTTAPEVIEEVKILPGKRNIDLSELEDITKSMIDKKASHSLINELSVLINLEKKYNTSEDTIELSSKIMNECIKKYGLSTLTPAFDGKIRYFKNEFWANFNKLNTYSLPWTGLSVTPKRQVIHGKIEKDGDKITVVIDDFDNPSKVLFEKSAIAGFGGGLLSLVSADSDKVDLRDMYVSAGVLNQGKKGIVGTIYGKTTKDREDYMMVKDITKKSIFDAKASTVSKSFNFRR